MATYSILRKPTFTYEDHLMYNRYVSDINKGFSDSITKLPEKIIPSVNTIAAEIDHNAAKVQSFQKQLSTDIMDLNRDVVESLGYLNENLSNDLDKLRWSLNEDLMEVRNGITELRASFDIAMGKVIAGFEMQRTELRQNLQNIIAILQNRHKEDAKEYLRDALEFYNEGCKFHDRPRWFKDAKDLFNKSLKGYPRNPVAHFHLGHIFHYQDEFRDYSWALEHYTLCYTYAEADKTQWHLAAQGYFYAGWMTALLGNVREAISLTLASIKLDNDLHESFYHLAKFHSIVGETTQAVDNLEKVIRSSDPNYAVKALLDPDFEPVREAIDELFTKIDLKVVYYEMAKAYLKQNDIDRSMFYIRRFIELYPSNYWQVVNDGKLHGAWKPHEDKVEELLKELWNEARRFFDKEVAEITLELEAFDPHNKELANRLKSELTRLESLRSLNSYEVYLQATIEANSAKDVLKHVKEEAVRLIRVKKETERAFELAFESATTLYKLLDSLLMECQSSGQEIPAAVKNSLNDAQRSIGHGLTGPKRAIEIMTTGKPFRFMKIFWNKFASRSYSEELQGKLNQFFKDAMEDERNEARQEVQRRKRLIDESKLKIRLMMREFGLTGKSITTPNNNIENMFKQCHLSIYQAVEALDRPDAFSWLNSLELSENAVEQLHNAISDARNILAQEVNLQGAKIKEVYERERSKDSQRRQWVAGHRFSVTGLFALFLTLCLGLVGGVIVALKGLLGILFLAWILLSILDRYLEREPHPSLQDQQKAEFEHVRKLRTNIFFSGEVLDRTDPDPLRWLNSLELTPIAVKELLKLRE